MSHVFGIIFGGISLVLIFLVWSFFWGSPASMAKSSDLMSEKPDNYPVATLAGGCFWCLESEFRSRPGVLYTRVGYTDGQTQNPTYREITTGQTGHAEAIEVYFDPEKTSYADLIHYFLTAAHDPTQVGGQWMDEGEQYRSAIYYNSGEQQDTAQAIIEELTTEKRFNKPIVTEIEPAGTFWEAEEYHQQYYEKYKAETGFTHIRVKLKEKRKKDLKAAQNIEK